MCWDKEVGSDEGGVGDGSSMHGAAVGWGMLVGEIVQSDLWLE